MRMKYFMLTILRSYHSLNIFHVQKINKPSESNLGKETECHKNVPIVYQTFYYLAFSWGEDGKWNFLLDL